MMGLMTLTFLPSLVSCMLIAAFLGVGAVSAQDFALRFYGHGVAAPDLDRVKIAIDDPADSLPGPPADVGADDFTIEFFLKGTLVANPAPPIACGANVNWINGNVVVDRDRYNQDRKFGISLGAGRVAFGVSGDGTGDRTLCGTSNVLDGAWHHVAVQRRRSDGRMWIFVDGVLEAEADGPDGDVSYPDDGVPCPNCCGAGEPCDGSDPYLVLGAEKHDAGAAYPSFSGLLDELRLSTVLRYAGPFTPPSDPFVVDADTAALYHFDEGPAGPCTGAIVDSTPGNASPGECRFGGSSPSGPVYVEDTPFHPAPTEIDAAVEPMQPLTIKLQPGKSSITKRIRVKVWNGSPNGTAAQPMQLVVDSDCPPGTIVGLPDFDGRTPGDQDTAVIAAGRSRSAKLTINVAAADFTSVHRRVPSRCTVELQAHPTAGNNADPTPDNNVAFMELNVFDASDPEQLAVPEFFLESFRASHPGKIEIRAGQSSQTKRVKAVVVNAGPAEATLTLAVDDGTCPPGTVGLPDFDLKTPGAQTSIAAAPGRKVRATIPVTVQAADFYSPTSRARARCIARLTATSSLGDTEISNNETRMVVNVYDRNDM